MKKCCFLAVFTYEIQVLERQADLAEWTWMGSLGSSQNQLVLLSAVLAEWLEKIVFERILKNIHFSLRRRVFMELTPLGREK